MRAEIGVLLACLAERFTHVAPPLAWIVPEVPLRLHARYTRVEILAAFGIGEGAHAWQTGVHWAEEARADLLAFTLDKASGQFSTDDALQRLRRSTTS